MKPACFFDTLTVISIYSNLFCRLNKCLKKKKKKKIRHYLSTLVQNWDIMG